MSGFCPECGAAAAVADDAAAAVSAEVEIARINANRDIKLAQINAGVVKEVAETEAAAEVAHADGVVDGIDKVLDAVGGDQGDGPPIVLPPAEPEAEPEPEPEPELPLPPVADTPEPEPNNRGGGWWDNYS